MPENIEAVPFIEAAMDLYRKTARSHNRILSDYLHMKEQMDWLKRQLFGTRSEKFHPTPKEQ